MSPKSYSNTPWVREGQASGSTARMVQFMRPASFSRRKGKARPPKLLQQGGCGGPGGMGQSVHVEREQAAEHIAGRQATPPISSTRQRLAAPQAFPGNRTYRIRPTCRRRCSPPAGLASPPPWPAAPGPPRQSRSGAAAPAGKRRKQQGHASGLVATPATGPPTQAQPWAKAGRRGLLESNRQGVENRRCV